jgi:hypothetical protein
MNHKTLGLYSVHQPLSTNFYRGKKLTGDYIYEVLQFASLEPDD